MRSFKIVLIFVIILFMATSCAQNEVIEPCLEGKTYNFWWGLLHGFIAPFNLVVMLFRDNIAVFAPNNNGFWYAFGFLIGSGGWGVLGVKSACRKK